MRVVVLGATGNVGTSVCEALGAEPEVTDIVGVARRLPELTLPKVTWAAADISIDPLDDLLAGADAVVHLAWLIQPSHDERGMWKVNVGGTERVLDAVARAGVRTVVYASSIGVYAPGPKDRRVDESWPTTGVGSSQYSRHKVEAERAFDQFEREYPDRRVVRMRKALNFKSGAAAGIERLFLGPFAPTLLLGRYGLPVVPNDPRFTTQAVHTSDVADAYRRALVSDVEGPVNLAAEPVLTPAVMAKVLGARPVSLPSTLLKIGAFASHRLRVQPVEPGWIDLATSAPLMDTTRARDELGWDPRISADDALGELLRGFATDDGMPTPQLHPTPH